MIWPFSRKPRNPPVQAPSGYPAGYVADPRRPDIFDPALRHYPRAFVKGLPLDGAEAAALRDARSRVLWTALRGLAPVRDLVVVRGSMTLESWFPGRARRAHDIDLVVRDATLAPGAAAAQALLSSLSAALQSEMAGEVDVLESEVTVDSIWTYERAEGRRLTVPWMAGTRRDAVQVDIVFREPLQDAPTRQTVSRGEPVGGYREGDAGATLWFASKAESLAWKVLWLDTDGYPQGKDLYDAVLLAEGEPLSLDLLERVYAGKGLRWRHETDTRFVYAWDVDWDAFARDCPALASGDRGQWLTRFAETLRLV